MEGVVRTITGSVCKGVTISSWILAEWKVGSLKADTVQWKVKWRRDSTLD